MVALMVPSWQYKNIKMYCDNDTVVNAVIKSRAPMGRRDLNCMVNKLGELSAQYHFRFWIEHIKGEENVIADALSRFKSAYCEGKGDLADYKFFPRKEAIKIANGIFRDLLNFKKVPYNDDDYRRTR